MVTPENSKKLLILCTQSCEEAITLEAFALLHNCEYKIEVINDTSILPKNAKNYQVVVIIGFTYTYQQIEELYLTGILHILTIDEYYDDHPLIKLNVNKEKMPFLNYRGKWAILVDDSSCYKTIIKELLI